MLIFTNGSQTQTESILLEIIPDENERSVKYDGLLVLPYGKLAFYEEHNRRVHLNYIVMEFQEGILSREKWMDGNSYILFCDDQFTKFSKTKEYELLKKRLIESHDHYDDETADKSIRNRILHFTKRILVP